MDTGVIAGEVSLRMVMWSPVAKLSKVPVNGGLAGPDFFLPVLRSVRGSNQELRGHAEDTVINHLD